MSSKDFVQFLKGFVMACGEAGPSQDQWHTLVTMLKNIEDTSSIKEPPRMKVVPDQLETTDTPNPYQSRGVPEWLKDASDKKQKSSK